MGKFNLSVWLILVVTFMLTSCTSVKTVDLNREGKGPSLVTGATERVVTNIDIVNRSIPGQVLPKRIVCAEPSPDVAEAFSKAISAGIKAGKGSAAFSLSTSRSIAQLGERLATVQLLRDMAYRNCEAYANGAISATSYTILNSRLHKTIATLLSSEMMVGAFGRNLAVLTPSSESEISLNNGDSIVVSAKSGSKGSEPRGEGGDSGAIGEISLRQQPPTEVADQLKQVHQNFIEDISFITLVDACIAHMSIPQKDKIEKYRGIVDLIKQANENKVALFENGIPDNLIDGDSSSANSENGSEFTKICEKSVLGEVGKLTERVSLAKTEIRKLQVINAIVNACNKDDKTRDSSVCKTLDISWSPKNNSIE